jgi:serine/threonine protein kinase
MTPPNSSTGTDTNTLPIGFTLAEFTIERVIGEGGFGIVYLALDTQLGRKVAIKEYMPSSLAARKDDLSVTVTSPRHRETFDLGLRSFVKEAVTLARFDHPALLKVFRFWEERGTAYMVMPYLEGQTLKQHLRARLDAPPEAWLRTLLDPLLDGLEHLHAHNCLHRDIAPDNIQILPSGVPLLLDFGAARQVIGDATQALTVILKPGFAPIEQYSDSVALRQGAWTDVYALAAVCYYAISGKTPQASVARVMHDEMPSAASIGAQRYSPEFLSFIDACLRVRPQDRPQSIAEARRLMTVLAPTSAASAHEPDDDDDRTIIRPSARTQASASTAPPQTTVAQTDAAGRRAAAHAHSHDHRDPVAGARAQPQRRDRDRHGRRRRRGRGRVEVLADHRAGARTRGRNGTGERGGVSAYPSRHGQLARGNATTHGAAAPARTGDHRGRAGSGDRWPCGRRASHEPTRADRADDRARQPAVQRGQQRGWLRLCLRHRRGREPAHAAVPERARPEQPHCRRRRAVAAACIVEVPSRRAHRHTLDPDCGLDAAARSAGRGLEARQHLFQLRAGRGQQRRDGRAGAARRAGLRCGDSALRYRVWRGDVPGRHR